MKTKLQKYWLDTFGEDGLEPVKNLDFYKPEYQEIMTKLYNEIKHYELLYEGWGRKIFCRELAERMLDLFEEYKNNDKKTN